ncbi:MAG TPA: hypothetical protein VGB38_07030, partial [bacterium]
MSAKSMKWGVVLLLSFCLCKGIGFAQTKTITFDEPKWAALQGHKYYRGGPANTMTDTELGVSFIIVYGEMVIVYPAPLTRMLFFSPIISSNGTTDNRGRIHIQFQNSIKRFKFQGSHSLEAAHYPALMTASFYQGDATGSPLQSLEVTDNVIRYYEYSNSTVGIKTVVIETQFWENNIDNIEFEDLSGTTTNVQFAFNDGTDQGWTLQGAYNENGTGPLGSNFTFGWKDAVNYPNASGKDPTGDQKGAIAFTTPSGHGVNSSGATFWIMRFYSPDLSSSSVWQSAKGYTAELDECLAGANTTVSANLFVLVYDKTQAKDRYFYNGDAALMQHDVYDDATAKWNHLTFDWSQVSNFPSSYTIKRIFINVWGQMNGTFQGGVYLDDVANIPGALPQPPAAPSLLDAALTAVSDQIFITWQDNAQDETGFTLQSMRLPGLGDWSDLATLGPNVTAYQMNGPSNNAKYYFRVCAFNANGSSAYSNKDSVYVAYGLNWIVLDSPIGDEQWKVGTVQSILWRKSNFSPPATVTLRYSTDGGSHWVSPPIASAISNSGSYAWTVPNTPSTNCLMRLESATQNSWFDLSNKPFTITTESPPWLAVAPTALDFGAASTSKTFNISNSGGGTLT